MTANRLLRVVTLNTWKNDGDLGARLPVMGACLRELAPDIVLLQEVFCAPMARIDTSATLAAMLGMVRVHAPARAKVRTWYGRDVDSTSGLAVLARGRICAEDRLTLPSDEIGGERIALLTHVEIDGARLMVGNTHLSHLRGDEARRREQLATVLAHPWWRAPAVIRLLGGDFNTTAESLALLAVNPADGLVMRDVFAASGASPATHPLPPRTGRGGRAIDILFTVGRQDERRPHVHAATVVLAQPVGGIWPSDHAGVMADLCVSSASTV